MEKIGVNILKILFNVKNVEELRKRYPDERGKWDKEMGRK